MKKLLALGLVLILTGCATAVPVGSLFYDGALPIADGDGSGSKTGKACMNSYFSIIATGDASIETAKANGGITDVATVDWEVENILGIFGEYCTVVTGS